MIEALMIEEMEVGLMIEEIITVVVVKAVVMLVKVTLMVQQPGGQRQLLRWFGSCSFWRGSFSPGTGSRW